MAHATSFDPATSVDTATAASEHSNRIVVVGVDRSRQFNRARRHTLLVKTMRWLLPFLTIFSLGLYAASAVNSVNFASSLGMEVVTRILPRDLTMDNPYYEGFTDDGGSYIVRAKTAQPDLKNPQRVRLKDITGTMLDAKKVKTDLTAGHGLFDSRQSVLRLDGGIDIVSEDGFNGKLKSAIVHTKKSTITSREPVELQMRGGRVNAQHMRVLQKERIIHFSKGVRTKLTPNTDEKSKDQQEAASATKSAAQTALLGASKEPIDINSLALTVDRAKGRATFSGQVMAHQADQTLQTQILEVTFKESEGGAGQKADARGLPDTSRIEMITSPKPLIMTRGKLEQVTGKSATFDAINQTAVISGSVVMSSGPDRRAFAEVAQIDSKSDTVLLTGNVVVNQGENELRGGRLFVDRAKGTSNMSTPDHNNGGTGRITARLKSQGEAGAGAKKKKATASKKQGKRGAGAKGKSSLPGFSSLSTTAFKGDPSAPINIEAERLDVDDKSKEAVFSGKVQAEQGPMAMSAEQLTAIYAGNAGLIGAQADAGGAGAASELTRIKAKGDVFVVSKAAGQNAKGDWADVDTKANTILLGGDVVLNQGKNVIRASLLKIDLNTGNAVIEASPEETVNSGWASTTVQRSQGEKSGPPVKIFRGNRPSAVFYPTQAPGAKAGKSDKKSKSGKSSRPRPAAAARPATASSWEAKTAPAEN